MICKCVYICTVFFTLKKWQPLLPVFCRKKYGDVSMHLHQKNGNHCCQFFVVKNTLMYQCIYICYVLFTTKFWQPLLPHLCRKTVVTNLLKPKIPHLSLGERQDLPIERLEGNVIFFQIQFTWIITKEIGIGRICYYYHYDRYS